VRAALACFVLLFAAAIPGWSADLYRVAGVVVDSETGSPKARVRVAIAAAQTMTRETAIVTGQDGRFAFEVPQGTFRLIAEAGGRAEIFGAPFAGSTVGSFIITGPDQDNASLTFRWHAPSAISGRVVDEAGEPVENALVQLLRADVRLGRRRVRTLQWDWSNDRGEYRFGAIAGGTYYLVVTARPWYSQADAIRIPGEVQESPAFAPVYYPQASNIAAASPLVVKPGEEAHADFALSPVPGATLRVTCTNPAPGTMNLSLLMDSVQGAQSYQRIASMVGRSIAIPGIPPGRYIVRVAALNGNDVVAVRQPIDVSGADADLQFTLRPLANVTGTVRLKNPASRPGGTLYASLLNVETGTSMGVVPVSGDGSFVIPSVEPGTYWPQVRGAAGYFVSEVTAEGSQNGDGSINVTGDNEVRLRVMVSGESGGVKGFVAENGRRIPAALAVLAPRKDRYLPGESRSYQTESDGSFDFRNMPAGEYYLFATEDAEFEYANPAAVRAYAGSAKLIRIDAHGALEETIGLAEAAAKK